MPCSCPEPLQPAAHVQLAEALHSSKLGPMNLVILVHVTSVMPLLGMSSRMCNKRWCCTLNLTFSAFMLCSFTSNLVSKKRSQCLLMRRQAAVPQLVCCFITVEHCYLNSRCEIAVVFLYRCSARCLSQHVRTPALREKFQASRWQAYEQL